VPARGQGPGAERLAVFRREAEAALATVATVASAAEVPQAVAEYLRNHNLPAAIRMGDDRRLAAMPWSATSLDIGRGPSDGSDLSAVSHAFGAVAESGSLV